MENSMEVSQKTKYGTRIWSRVPPLGIYPEKTTARKDTRTPVFTAAQYTIAKTWEQPKYPSADERN